MNYTITSPDYPEYSVIVNGPRVIAYGVAESIHKQQKIDVVIYNKDGDKVDSFVKGENQ